MLRNLKTSLSQSKVEGCNLAGVNFDIVKIAVAAPPSRHALLQFSPNKASTLLYGQGDNVLSLLGRSLSYVRVCVCTAFILVTCNWGCAATPRQFFSRLGHLG